MALVRDVNKGFEDSKECVDQIVQFVNSVQQPSNHGVKLSCQTSQYIEPNWGTSAKCIPLVGLHSSTNPYHNLLTGMKDTQSRRGTSNEYPFANPTVDCKGPASCHVVPKPVDPITRPVSLAIFKDNQVVHRATNSSWLATSDPDLVEITQGLESVLGDVHPKNLANVTLVHSLLESSVKVSPFKPKPLNAFSELGGRQGSVSTATC